MKVFVDTNVILRLFVNDDSVQEEYAHDLFRRAEHGEVDLITGPPVLFEMAWTMMRRYKIDKEHVLDYLEAVVSFPGMKITDKDIVTDAIALARETGTEYADSYIAVSAERAKADCVATFNEKHFARPGCDLYSF